MTRYPTPSGTAAYPLRGRTRFRKGVPQTAVLALSLAKLPESKDDDCFLHCAQRRRNASRPHA
jgi:hypothetical protein